MGRGDSFNIRLARGNFAFDQASVGVAKHRKAVMSTVAIRRSLGLVLIVEYSFAMVKADEALFFV